MSAQTGRPSMPAPPPSSRRLERARAEVLRLSNNPNPVWLRELRQSARLQRTPIILAVVTGMITLLICSVGGVASVTAEPAKVGVALFHTFFSVAFSVVTWVGPAVSANTIASERGGRTWEALLLTGLGSKTVARGKFLASLTYISLYIVMLAPVGVLPFLFGGVTATEVMAAFFLLFLFAVLSVAFGLSISSKFSTPAVAIVVTLLIAIPFSVLVYGTLGPLLSIAVHDLWPGVPSGPPVWLPTAYVRADFGLEYLAFLLLTPLAAVAVPGWLLYEITLANMAGPSDDRSTGLRRWFVVCAPLIAFVTLLPGFVTREYEWLLAGMGVAFVFLLFAAFVFAGEPLGPSRRVQVHWDRERTSRLKRYLGPGILRASTLLLLQGLALLLIQTAAGALIELGKPSPVAQLDAGRVLAFGMYTSAFFVFVVGFAAWSRARAVSAAVPRLLLLGALFVAAVGPWIAMAIAGIATDGRDMALIVAAPSPTYALVMANAVGQSGAERDIVLAAGALCAGAWSLLGVGLLTAATARVRKALRAERDRLTHMEVLLRHEDETRFGKLATTAQT